jgi:hypothetical protein
MRFITFILFLLIFPISLRAEISLKMICGDEELDANCIANGRVEAIYLKNYVTVEDFNQVAYVAAQIAIDKPFPKVIVNVEGGNMDAAIGIGRILRWRKASVETEDITNPLVQSKCLSSCVVLAVGAVRRNLSMIGIHTGYLKYDGDSIEAYQPMPQESKARLREYYDEMGVSKEMQVIEANTPFWEMSYFFYNPDLSPSVQKIIEWGFKSYP